MNIALAICARLFIANTLEDFAAVVADSESQLQKRPEPFDFFELLYKSLQREAHERVLVLCVAKEWSKKKDPNMRILDVEPGSWRIELKDSDEVIHEIETRKDPSFHLYESPGIIIEDENGDSQKIFVDFEALSNLYQTKP